MVFNLTSGTPSDTTSGTSSSTASDTVSITKNVGELEVVIPMAGDG